MNDNIQKLIASYDIEPFWSAQQLAIFCWFAYGSGNLVARARAGTGKTTTIIRALDFAPEDTILVCAFNKKIEIELTKRIKNAKAIAKTLHALGLSLVRKVWENMRIERDNERGKRADGLTFKVCPSVTPDAVKRLVSKLHTKGREICPHAKNMGDLTDLLYKFECEPEEQWVKDGYDAAFVEARALEAMELAATQRPLFIDFADMIFLPLRNGWLRPMYDLVVVDEAQDMNPAQLELAQGVCNGRLCLVGDDRQAIYDFRGADSNGLDRLKVELKAEELGLTTTYRCGKVIVKDANRLVPDFTAGENNPEGEIIHLAYDKLVETANHGDFVLSRKNAPIAKVAMAFLRNQKRARVSGRDIGQGLKAIMRKINTTNSVPELLRKLDLWQGKEIDRAIAAKQESRVEYVQDQAETIRVISDGATGVKDIEARIDYLFSDDGQGDANVIACSSIHKAKGLEADRVFVLVETLYAGGGAPALLKGKKKPQTPAQRQEEANLEYVAITRAKKTLVKVTGIK